MFVIVRLEQQSGEVKSDSGSDPHLGTWRTLPGLADLCSPVGTHTRGGERISKDNSGRCALAHSLCGSHDPHSMIFVLPTCPPF